MNYTNVSESFLVCAILSYLSQSYSSISKIGPGVMIFHQKIASSRAAGNKSCLICMKLSKHGSNFVVLKIKIMEGASSEI